MKKYILFLFLLYYSLFNLMSQSNAIIYGDNPKAGHYAPVNGIQIYYEIYGTGKPLLLFHGNGGSIMFISSSINKINGY